MTTVHIAHAIGSTGSTAAKYRVDVRVGAHRLIADEPVTIAIREGTPITTTFRTHDA